MGHISDDPLLKLSLLLLYGVINLASPSYKYCIPTGIQVHAYSPSGPPPPPPPPTHTHTHTHTHMHTHSHMHTLPHHTCPLVQVKAAVLDPDNDFNVERTLTKDDVQTLIQVSQHHHHNYCIVTMDLLSTN